MEWRGGGRKEVSTHSQDDNETALRRGRWISNHQAVSMNRKCGGIDVTRQSMRVVTHEFQRVWLNKRNPRQVEPRTRSVCT